MYDLITSAHPYTYKGGNVKSDRSKQNVTNFSNFKLKIGVQISELHTMLRLKYLKSYVKGWDRDQAWKIVKKHSSTPKIQEVLHEEVLTICLNCKLRELTHLVHTL